MLWKIQSIHHICNKVDADPGRGAIRDHHFGGRAGQESCTLLICFVLYDCSHRLHSASQHDAFGSDLVLISGVMLQQGRYSYVQLATIAGTPNINAVNGARPFRSAGKTGRRPRRVWSQPGATFRPSAHGGIAVLEAEVDGSGGSCIRLGGKSASGDVNEVGSCFLEPMGIPQNRRTASSHSLEHPAQSAGSMVIRSGVAMLFVAGEKGREQARKQRGSRENWVSRDVGLSVEAKLVRGMT